MYLGELDVGDRPKWMRLMRSELVMHQVQKMHTQTQGEMGGREEQAAVDGHQCPDMDEWGEEGEEAAQAKEMDVETRIWMKGQGPMMFLAPMMLVRLTRV
jgi:hypothetical protein